MVVTQAYPYEIQNLNGYLARMQKSVLDKLFFLDKVFEPFEKSLLNLSSVVHEVYSYCTPEEIAQFWDRVFHSGFRYVCIRDMAVSETALTAADEKEIALIRGETRYAAHLKDYEAVWGPLQSRKDLVHYLLKYKYTENWEREVREDYLGLSAEALMKLIPEEYEETRCEHFTLPYTAWQIKNDFGMELNVPTHIKLILKKRSTG